MVSLIRLIRYQKQWTSCFIIKHTQNRLCSQYSVQLSKISFLSSHSLKNNPEVNQCKEKIVIIYYLIYCSGCQVVQKAEKLKIYALDTCCPSPFFSLVNNSKNANLYLFLSNNYLEEVENYIYMIYQLLELLLLNIHAILFSLPNNYSRYFEKTGLWIIILQYSSSISKDLNQSLQKRTLTCFWTTLDTTMPLNLSPKANSKSFKIYNKV